MRIMIVDNDTALLRSLEILLRARGYTVVSHSDPMDAARECEQNSVPEALIVDYMMPAMQGNELLARIGPHLPDECRVIVISGHTDKIDQQQMSNLGMTAFLPKPLDLDRLCQLVNGNSGE